ncbi:XRE family transcriptional regulator [Pseudomonas donghuensis]
MSILAAFEFESRQPYGAEMKKKPLPQDRIEECSALKAIFLEKRKELGLTQEKAAEALGMNQGSFSHYLNGRNSLNVEFAAKVAKLLGVPVSSFSPRLAGVIELMGEANAALSERAYEHIKHYAEIAESNVMPAQQPWRASRKYPLISWIAAGEKAESPDNLGSPNTLEYLESTENAGEHGYWLEVKGPSMTGSGATSFPEGTRILIKPEGFDLISGKYYVARHRDGEKTFKQYLYDAGCKYLAPLNPAFKAVEMDHDWEVIGRAIDAKIPGL